MRINTRQFFLFYFMMLLIACSNDDDGFSNSDFTSDDICLVEINGEFLETQLDKPPMFINGGREGLANCMGPIIRYPSIAKENGTEGIVKLQYVIDPNGDIENISIAQDIGDGCGEETKRVLEACTIGNSFEPGEINGIPHAVKKQMSFTFKLE